jgi:hypothetical protein
LERWDGTRRPWDANRLRWQCEYSLGMKATGPANATFAVRHISSERAKFRALRAAGAKPDRLIFSEFRMFRKWLPGDQASR